MDSEEIAEQTAPASRWVAFDAVRRNEHRRHRFDWPWTQKLKSSWIDSVDKGDAVSGEPLDKWQIGRSKAKRFRVTASMYKSSPNFRYDPLRLSG